MMGGMGSLAKLDLNKDREKWMEKRLGKFGRMVVKVQLPLFTTHEGPQALVTNEDKSVLVEVPLSGPLAARVGKKMKAYFAAEVSKNTIELLDLVPDQPW